MNYVFWGTPPFGARVLRALLLADLAPQILVCNPDRPAGRNLPLTQPATKQIIRDRNFEGRVEILQPEDPASIIPKLSSVRPDFFVVAAYGKILSADILRIPIKGVIGVHPSLLPRHRGASPIQTAILEGDAVTGVTLFLLDEKMDHGPILIQEQLPLRGEETFLSLRDALADIGAALLIKKIPDFLADNINPAPQDESQATYTKKFKTEDACIDADALRGAMREGGYPAMILYRKIRALNPEPGAYTVVRGARVKILEARLLKGKLHLISIQREGKTPTYLNSSQEIVL